MCDMMYFCIRVCVPHVAPMEQEPEPERKVDSDEWCCNFTELSRSVIARRQYFFHSQHSCTCTCTLYMYVYMYSTYNVLALAISHG